MLNSIKDIGLLLPNSNLFTALIASGFGAVAAILHMESSKMRKLSVNFEYFALLLINLFAGIAIIGLQDLFALMCALELQTFCLYGLCMLCSQNGAVNSITRYLIIHLIVSAVGFYGLSLIYGFNDGSLEYQSLARIFNNPEKSGACIGLFLFCINIWFKLSLAPFHLWTLDLYSSISITTINYIATAQKFTILLGLINLIKYLPISPILSSWLLLFLLTSLILASICILTEKNIKKIVAYSELFNTSYLLVPMTMSFNQDLSKISIFYLLAYMINGIGFTAILASLSKAEKLEDLSGVGRRYKWLGIALIIVLFSNVGIPPLSGFFGKYFILHYLFQEQQICIALLAIGCNLVMSFYVLNMLKVVYFDQTMPIKLEGRGIRPLAKLAHHSLVFIAYLSISFILGALLVVEEIFLCLG
ncbi:proton-conducting transporter transmembrane domain-containing protein [Candidatus Sarmatiella mevalonica]|uniref:proton-conducting transporter transmembrane domain-containing protein n=1 Tax=Candidatus Sarmatiella mevalonica TaxID=2770581 RepID=UPI001921E666|nr:proton-conducting transporter membrane subunit [Candidatus Sarmatiella mevalonica]